MKNKFSGLLWLILLAFITRLFNSCISTTCLEETTAYLNAGFYRSGTGITYTPDSITVYGFGMNSNKLYTKATKLSSIKLPLDASSGTCGFIMKINNITDTLIFTYSSFPYLISKECGYTFFFNLDSCIWRGSIIDTINIRNKKITTFNDENIRIFY